MRSGLHLTVVLVLLSAAGCAGTDVLNSSGATLLVSISATNISTEFESTQFTVNQVTLRPADSNANNALGQVDIGLLEASLVIDALNSPSDGTASPITFGTYRVESVQIGQLFLLDADPPVGQATCEEYLTIYCTGPLGQGCNGFTGNTLMLNDFGQDVFVTIGPGEEATLDISIDVGALTTAFVDAHVCTQAGCPGNAPWCILRFSSGDFTAESPTFLDFD